MPENIIFIRIILNKTRTLPLKFMLGLDYGFLLSCSLECIPMQIHITKSVNRNTFIPLIRTHLFNTMWAPVKVLFIIISD